MKSHRLSYLLGAALLTQAVFPFAAAYAQGDVTAETALKKVKPPELYGAIVIDKNSRESKTGKPVVFLHWSHRTKYTCSVCHTDLGFPLKAGETDIKQADIEAGKYCGACHNGKTAFGANECLRCHSYDAGAAARMDDTLRDLPKDDFGNKVNWVKALRDGKIKPAASLKGGKEMAVVDLDVVIPPTKFAPHPPDVLYPHKPHTELLDCTSCHTAIFEMQKGGNPQMNMMKIISGQYCGVCHGKVSFPLQDCFRCHSQPLPPPPPEPKPGEKERPKRK